MRSALLGVVVLSGCMVGEPDEARVVSADEGLPADLAAGDVIRAGELELMVPEPGHKVSMTAELDDGTSMRLEIHNRLDGLVELITPDEEPLIIAAADTSECNDGEYNLEGHAWASEYFWYFNADSTPNRNNVDKVETALVNAVTSITTSRNSCALSDQVGATHRYMGRKDQAPNIRGTATRVRCGNPDGMSTVGFGTLPGRTLAIACTWTEADDRTAFDGDIKFNTAHDWFALAVPADCSDKYGVQAVATHEFGHVFGIGHVSKDRHPHLTMSTKTVSCTNYQTSLGLGDVRGLRALY